MGDNQMNGQGPASGSSEGGESMEDETQVSKPAERWYGIDLRNIGLRVLSLNLVYYAKHLTALYLNNNNLTTLPTELFSRLTALTHLDLSFNHLTHLPVQIGQLVHLEALSVYHNRITELPLEVGRLFRLKQLGIDGNPITQPPMAVLQQGTDAIRTFLRDRMPPPPPPPERTWSHYVDDPSSIPVWRKLRVFCYNILAQSYASPERYSYTPSWALDWEYRKLRLLKEMLAANADFICLQEVEAEQFSEYFEPEMTYRGYAGVFKPKGRARTMEDWRGVDGCVIFYKRERFVVKQEFTIEYQSKALARHEILQPESRLEMSDDDQPSMSGLDRLMMKDNVALALLLETRPNQTTGERGGQQVLLANTHIHWDPTLSDVKLMQTQLMLEELEEYEKALPQRVPLIVCGDFNSTPDSSVYKLLSRGEISPNDDELLKFNYGKYSRDGMTHNLNLLSSFSQTGEPNFTNYTSDFVGVLDYIFHTRDLKVIAMLDPVDEETVLSQSGALPSPYMCSDHISLLAEYDLQGGSGSNGNTNTTTTNNNNNNNNNNDDDGGVNSPSRSSDNGGGRNRGNRGSNSRWRQR